MLTTMLVLLTATFADTDNVVEEPAIFAAEVISAEPSSSVKVDEEFIITDSIEKKLKGSLKDAFNAYQAGNYAVAEKKFSALARLQHRIARQRRFVEQALELNRGRRLSSSYGFGYEAAYTPVSAPNAKARAFAQPLPLLQIRRSASKLFYLEGVSQLRQNKIADAVETFERALSVDKFNFEARIEYAIASLKEGDVATAGKELETINDVAAKYCNEERCIFSDDSKKRHTRLRVAYQNMLKRS